MQTHNTKMDDLDRTILKTLMEDARTRYAEMAEPFRETLHDEKMAQSVIASKNS